jgi:hypothetical protein
VGFGVTTFRYRGGIPWRFSRKDVSMSETTVAKKRSPKVDIRAEVRRNTVQDCMPGGFTYLGVQEFSSSDDLFEVHAATDHHKQLLTHQDLNSLMVICWTAALGVNKGK